MELCLGTETSKTAYVIPYIFLFVMKLGFQKALDFKFIVLTTNYIVGPLSCTMNKRIHKI